MRNVALCAVFTALVAACEPPPQKAPPPAQPPAAVPVPVAQARFHIAQPLYELADTSGRVERTLAQARGVVVPTYVRPAPRELSVINDTMREISTLARVRFYPLPDGGWSDTIWTREPNLYGGLIRATHDDYGLPVLSRHGEWLRVAYAFAADGSTRAGWVRLVPGKLVYHDVDRQLLEFSTSLVQPEGTEFFAAPNGPQVHVDLAPSHTLQVVRIGGDWIQVVIMRPDTSACTGDESLQVLARDTVWVRRYDATGKRQLQSAIAGC
jgi:hypothetical protein